MPHAVESNIRKFAVAFGRVKKGIDFRSLDGQKTCLFFMIAIPCNKTNTQLKIIARIARLIRDRHTLNCLLKAGTEDRVIDIIKTAENKG